MILRNFCFFSEHFQKNFPILRWIRHFQRDETRDARDSEGGEWYQIVRWPKAFNSSYNRDLRVGKLTSGGQFSEKIRNNYALKWRIFFSNFVSEFSFQIYLISSTSHLLNSNLKKTFFSALSSPVMDSLLVRWTGTERQWLVSNFIPTDSKKFGSKNFN